MHIIKKLYLYYSKSYFINLASHFCIGDAPSVIFWVPVYDRIIVPVARKYTGHENGFTQLQRMGIGLFISIFSMVSAAMLELKRLEMVRSHNSYELKTVPLSIFWQAPQYFLIGCAEVFHIHRTVGILLRAST
ncbi:hypothetical protein NC652_002617 [Populus alba x Populus x berolinensis]|nr:hypothetical protein NC652_002617 [Populus alba x Populus x berolinensis]